ncbi:hypothetical protein CcCBS67573_g10424 [Chytriomyces confervae]|uniref:enoyl-[acyl-carrier-protein] reductase n=1 Tax=Chytriomyces confervae TaxID=246404 RepID=A0A507CY99_9FUNG|nr:hypothetical protein CcCBS67573_g10424 [Chytriomyces confervae]
MRSLSSSLSIGFSKHGAPESSLALQRTLLSSQRDAVTVRFRLSPVNPADINQIQGTYPILPKLQANLLQNDPETPFAICGNEGVAEIVSVGENVDTAGKDWIKVGSRVVMKSAGAGTWSQYAVMNPSNLVPMNNSGVSDLAAATIMVNPCTAYRMLRDFEDLKPGDTVIQNGANSAVGQAVIQIAKSRNLKTINIIRGTTATTTPRNSTTKSSTPPPPRPDLDALRSRLTALGADMVVTEEEIRTDRSIQQHLKSSSTIKLGLNCVGGKSAASIARWLQPSASLVTYGGMSKQPVEIPTSLLIFKDLKVKGFWMTRWNELAASKAELEVEREAMIRELCRLSAAGLLATPDCEIVDVDGDGAECLEIVKRAVDVAMRGGSGKKQVFRFLD